MAKALSKNAKLLIVLTGRNFLTTRNVLNLFRQMSITGVLAIGMVFIMLVLALILGFVGIKTIFGRRVYGIGGNRDAARLSGINVKKHILIAVWMDISSKIIMKSLLKDIDEE